MTENKWASSSKRNWKKIRAAYEAGEGSYRVLSERFNVPQRTIEDHSRREGWAKGRAIVHEKAVEKLHDALAEKIADEMLSDIQIIDNTIQKLYNKLDDTEPKSMEAMATAIARLIMAKRDLLSDADEEGEETTGIQWERLVIEDNGDPTS